MKIHKKLIQIFLRKLIIVLMKIIKELVNKYSLKKNLPVQKRSKIIMKLKKLFGIKLLREDKVI